MVSDKRGQALSRLMDRAGSLGLLVSGIMIMLMGVIVTYGATRRYFFNSPDQYSSEISTILSVAAAAFSIFAVQWFRRNIRVDFLVVFFPPVVHDILLDIIGTTLALFFTITVTWQSWRAGLYSFRVGEVSTSVWAIPLWPIKLLVPLGFGLLCLVLIVQLYHGLISLKERAKKKGQ